MSKIGEVELQTTYFDVFLSEIIADQDQQVDLRWANKSVHQDLTDMRPDAIISTLGKHECGCFLGFGEQGFHHETIRQFGHFPTCYVNHLQVRHQKARSTGLFNLYDKWIFHLLFYHIQTS